MPPNADKSSPSASPRERDERHSGPYDDEISLIDLWRVLARRKWWIAAVTVIVFVLGTGYGLLQTPTYTFLTTIQIGLDNNRNPIESPEVKVSFLNDVLIPGIRRDMQEEYEEGRPPEARSRHVEGTNFLQLTSSSPLDRREEVRELHTLVTRGLRSEFNPRVEDLRSNLEDDREELILSHQARMQEMAYEADSIDERITLTNERLALLEEEKKLLAEHIDQLEPLRERLEETLANPQDNSPLWALMPQTSIVEMRHSAERGLLTDLPNRIQETRLQLAELEASSQKIQEQMAQEEQRHERSLSALNRELERIQEVVARGSDYALASERPEGPGRSLFAALSLVLGLMLGVFGAFFREFLANVRAAENS
ncbi:Wzz/FepE/Etk N-terminal domain-containing protein [Thioalkalivibrio sp. ALgr1]|uniref:Wzz/FepE/Etk N-terminal domain-containing protein n=1 Tax=Thioalkalivibrio sp. ALgr1 TaxID=748655 RepID=UPI00035E9456|nr:Wzz/FepE/Etk N-terminal domain-containing protein [Thioalkalivibrio sp. ALgr1]